MKIGYCRTCQNVIQSRQGHLVCKLKYVGENLVRLNQVCTLDRWELDRRVLEDLTILGTVEGDEIKQPGGLYISREDYRIYRFVKPRPLRYNNIDGFELVNYNRQEEL